MPKIYIFLPVTDLPNKQLEFIEVNRLEFQKQSPGGVL